MKCPDCEGEISLPKDVIEGEVVSCPDCGESYEAYLDKGQFALRPAEVVGEDWGE